jgi:hypothetical protein
LQGMARVWSGQAPPAARGLPHPQSRIRGPVRLLVPPRITLRGGGTITRRSPYWGCVSR